MYRYSLDVAYQLMKKYLHTLIWYILKNAPLLKAQFSLYKAKQLSFYFFYPRAYIYRNFREETKKIPRGGFDIHPKHYISGQLLAIF